MPSFLIRARRAPLQAILGQLYLAILVARRVALHLLADSRALAEGRE